MTEAEQPEQPQLTRKQMRQIRNTAANQIIVPTADGDVEVDAAPDDAAAPEVSVETSVPPAPLPRAAAPVEVAPAPDANVDLGVSPLTRRQARQQERIRTASVPVITPDVAAAHAEGPAIVDAVPTTDPLVADDPAAVSGEPVEADVAPDLADEQPEPTSEVPSDEPADDAQDDATPDAGPDVAALGIASEPEERATLADSFGSELLAGQPVAVTPPPTFDQLLTRGTSTSGSGTAANALILSQTPEGALMGPVAATGEVLVTGTFALPDGLGSQGHAPGTADGREVDAVLVDGELPAHSSPTPIAASAAISTVKSTGEIIRPPAPEKGSRLMVTLAITAGVLALALVGVLILAFVTGAI
jgi:hypothetical protein